MGRRPGVASTLVQRKAQGSSQRLRVQNPGKTWHSIHPTWGNCLLLTRACYGAFDQSERGRLAHAKSHDEDAVRGVLGAPTATPPSLSALSHGGYPGTPSATAPPTTRPTPLSNLGDHAAEYKLAPNLIEEKDLSFFNFFADGISNPRLKNHYKKTCSDSGRLFIATFIREMDDDGSSLTAEDTVEARMRAILAGGLAGRGHVRVLFDSRGRVRGME